MPGWLPHHEASRCWVLGQLPVSLLLLASHWGDTHLSWGPDGGQSGWWAMRGGVPRNRCCSRVEVHVLPMMRQSLSFFLFLIFIYLFGCTGS